MMLERSIVALQEAAEEVYGVWQIIEKATKTCNT